MQPIKNYEVTMPARRLKSWDVSGFTTKRGSTSECDNASPAA